MLSHLFTVYLQNAYNETFLLMRKVELKDTDAKEQIFKEMDYN
jgi:hypothetical protein